MSEVRVVPDSEALAEAAAETIAVAAEQAAERRGRFTLALAGGSTPEATYARLARPNYAGRFDWERTHIFWGDERCVPPDHPDSNARMARDVWLSKAPIPEDRIHRIQAELEPPLAAERYEGLLRQVLPAGGPAFDLVLLGLGHEGHTASLFPGSAALRERERWVTAAYVEKMNAWRITLTPVLLNRAREILFLVSGEKKAHAVKEVLTGKASADEVPARAIRPRHGRLTWLLDSAAASELSRHSGR